MEEIEQAFIKTIHSRKLYRNLVLVVSIVVLVMITYMLVMHVSIKTLLSVDPVLLSLATILYGASNIVDALRLKILFKNVGYYMSIIDALKARIIGNVIALATPSSIGGEPVRALVLSSYDIRLTRAIAVTLFEDYWDIVIINVPAIIFAVMRLPLTIFILLSSLYNVIAWNILFLATRREGARVFVLKLRDKSFGIIKRFLELIIVMIGSVKQVSTSLSLKSTIKVVLITLAKYAILYSSFLVAAYGIGYVDLRQVFEALMFYNAMGLVPTPGAAGGAEYGLSMALSPEQVIVVRTVAFFTTIILGLPVLVLYVRKLHEKSITNTNVTASS